MRWLICVTLLSSVAWADDKAVAALIEHEEYETLEALKTESFRKATPPNGLAKLFAEVRSRTGALKCTVDAPNLVLCRGTTPPAVKVALYFEGEKLSGMRVEPARDGRDSYVLKARVRPPFAGTWTAHNANLGPDSGHYGNPNQRFAVDWVMRGSDGKTFRGEHKQNADYLCYGQPALAVAPGMVVMVIDGVPENVPGKMDGYNIGGNQIAIDLGQGEYAYYAHIQPGTFKVKVGDKVVAGQPLGLVGNSGNSSEPHLHFQVSTAPQPYLAESLPVEYRDVLLDGKKVDRARPKTGQTLAVAEAK